MKLILDTNKASLIRQGHPWVFPKALRDPNPSLEAGAWVELVSDQGERLGVGVYNPHSLYRVRVLARAQEPISKQGLAAIIQHRLTQADLLRQRLNLPNSETNAFRLFNSEADGLSGLVIDRFDSICVIASSAYWVEMHRELILDCLQKRLPQATLLWLPQVKPLKQDGWEATPKETSNLHTIVKEHGIQFHIHFSNAQKTGLYLDQRDNHQRLSAYASGARVLDLYTYSGGFALHATKAGAEKVVAVDSSEAAIARAKENAALNDLNQIEFVKADARTYLQQAGDFDIVVLDPPKLIPSVRNQLQAKNYYRFLHREVFKSMKPNTLIMTCNCSSALSSKAFTELVYLQALAVQKNLRILGVYGPAVCHPTLPTFPEGQYLTALLAMVE